MLEFTDLHMNKHIVNINNLNNVVIRDTGTSIVMTFHLRDHTNVASVDKVTAQRLQTELMEHV